MKNQIRKPRADSVLNNLPFDQQRRILDWLTRDTYRAVLEKIAAPAPYGLGRKVHYNSLRRFSRRHAITDRGSEFSGRKPLHAPAAKMEVAPNSYASLNLEALERYCFHLAMDPRPNSDLLLKFSRLVLGLRQQEIASQKLISRRQNRNIASRQQPHEPLSNLIGEPSVGVNPPQTSRNSKALSSNEHAIAQRNLPIAR